MQDGVEHFDGEESLEQTELSDETSVPDGIAELSTSKLQIKEKTYSCNDCTYKSAIKHNLSNLLRFLKCDIIADFCVFFASLQTSFCNWSNVSGSLLTLLTATV